MIARRESHRIVGPDETPASRDDWEVIGAFNAAAARVGDEIVLLLRVAERPKERRPGFLGVPAFTYDGEITVEWLNEGDWDCRDPRLIRKKGDVEARLTSVSHLLVARSKDGRSIDSFGPRFMPAHRLETMGIEDPRITPFGDRFLVTYVAVSEHGVCTALASTTDFHSFERHGVIFGPENKDVVLFPERIGGMAVAAHRPSGGAGFCPPEMWLARSPDLECWGGHVPLYRRQERWESIRLGGGPPPIHTPEGWLLLYHGNGPGPQDGGIGVYATGALLLDLEHPERVLARTREPLLAPVEDWERRGFVPNVLFPTGLVPEGDRLLIYSGAGDACTGMIAVDRADVMAALMPV
ncbi:MAG TPA: glycoside hydrolase family 130 protein [Planctomycetia bacterium]|nr:glycoside hydrolase family 130 protein [Planctomycetia bacterium]